ncbi:hypothetical protein R3P38DRAFT_2942312 [Favolaschia claudopus]|uniref:PWWP domain-containing protein n=1 Tax=Favolaschia claudopus TaxID=2862362 RepID=A0AAW0BKE8_9AGAR
MWKVSRQLIPMHFLWCRISTMATVFPVWTPGDIYIDIKPGACAVYARLREHWEKWPGPAVGLSEQLIHPHLPEAERRARYVNFAPDRGIEWVASQTYVRRQESLRELGLLEDHHATSAQAGLDLASTIVEKYLIKTKVLEGSKTRVKQLSSTPSCVIEVSSDSDSDADVVSRPSKRARTTPKAPTDPEIQKLEQIFTALQTDQKFRQLNARKRELLRTLTAQCSSNISPKLLKTLEKHFFYASAAPTITAAEAEQAIPELKAEINQVKDSLRAMEARRKAAEQQLTEYERKQKSTQWA